MRTSLILAAIAAISLSASAQLKVVSNGQSQIGTPESLMVVGPITPGTLSTNNGTNTIAGNVQDYETAGADTLAPLCVMGLDIDGSWPRIAFGKYNRVSVGEGGDTSDKRKGNGILTLKGSKGISFIHGATKIFYYTPTSTDRNEQIFYFQRKVTAPQYLTTSDARSKTDIEELDNAGALLKNLVPVSYVLVSEESQAENSENNLQTFSNEGENDASAARHQYGFLAQDVREIFPDLVYEDADGMLSLDYQGFIPILVDAVKSLQTTVEQQAETIRTLTGQQTGQQYDGTVVASLSQNRPNPFNTSTVISCVVPESVANAFLCVYDLNGNQKMRRDISARGDVDVTIDGNSLYAGMYIYTLIADGVEVDSKRMILTD